MGSGISIDGCYQSLIRLVHEVRIGRSERVLRLIQPIRTMPIEIARTMEPRSEWRVP